MFHSQKIYCKLPRINIANYQALAKVECIVLALWDKIDFWGNLANTLSHCLCCDSAYRHKSATLCGLALCSYIESDWTLRTFRFCSSISDIRHITYSLSLCYASKVCKLLVPQMEKVIFGVLSGENQCCKEKNT